MKKIKRNIMAQVYANGDYRWLEKHGLDHLAFIMKCSLDYDYLEDFVMGRAGSYDAIRKIQEMAGHVLMLLVPKIGIIVETLNYIGLNLGIFKSIDDSNRAQNRLVEWRDFIHNNYANRKEYERYYHKATNNLQRLIDAKPQCVEIFDFDKSCPKEHGRYLMRSHLLKQSQDHDFYLLNNLLFSNSRAAEDEYDIWLGEVYRSAGFTYDYEKDSFIDEKEEEDSREETSKQKINTAEFGPFLLLLPLLMSKN